MAKTMGKGTGTAPLKIMRGGGAGDKTAGPNTRPKPVAKFGAKGVKPGAGNRF